MTTPLTPGAAKKSLGQHFLFDPSLLKRVANAGGAVEGKTVIEVGPGPGGLTRALLDSSVGKLIAIELDDRFAEGLALWPEARSGQLHVHHGDARRVNIAETVKAVGGELPAMIVANLPYNVGTELLIRWLTPAVWPPVWDSLTLMFQKEVAERITAKPGSKAYGRLALLAQWRCDCRIVMVLPPEAFTPPPKIHSAVVHLTALPEPRYPANPAILNRIVAAGFNQRRKMLRSSLKGIAPDIETCLTEAGIPPTARAEEISLERFCALARIVAAR